MNEFFDPTLIPKETTFFTIWLLGVSLGLTAWVRACCAWSARLVSGR